MKHRSWAEIDLAALERNLKRIRSALSPHIKYLAVVKADAYGHGMRQTVARLMHSGADMFAVANIGEASEIREIGSGWPILILSAILPEEDRHLIEYNVIPTISTADEVERFAKVGKCAGRPLPVHLKIDTGMGRLGVWHEQAATLYHHIKNTLHLTLTGVYTHFSSAESDPDFTEHQRILFLQTLNRLPGLERQRLLIHADNSASLESFSPHGSFNAVRIGLLQFGVFPYPQSFLARVKIEPVFSFHASVSMIKEIPAGTGISYGRTHILKHDARTAIITAGYGDGIPTTVSNRGAVLIRGQRCPILGRVTMDQTVVDVTHLPQVTVGDPVTLIGRQGKAAIEATEFSQWADHIPWEIFCSITKRVPRIYRTDTAL